MKSLPASKMYRIGDRVRLDPLQAPPGLVRKFHGSIATVHGIHGDECGIDIVWDGKTKVEGWHKNYFEVVR